MVKKKKVFIFDVAKAKFIDRFFYYLLNHLAPDLECKSYMTINPLKWSLLTLVVSLWIVLVYLVVIPLIGIPAIIYDAYKMPKKYDKDEGWYVENVWLIREI